MDLSIVIPCFNEQETLPEQIERLTALTKQMAKLEVIFVDGGSSDGSCSLLANAGFLTVHSELGRAQQMNAGAEQSSGRFVLFLHCDTYLPDDFGRVWSAISAHDPSWGFFQIRLSSKRKIYRVIEWFINRRSRISHVATGDQALFVRRDVWDKLGGYAGIPIMEDVELTKRLRRIAKPYKALARVQTSSRRWEENGWLRTVVLMWLIRGAYFFGVKPSTLARFYRRHKE